MTVTTEILPKTVHDVQEQCCFSFKIIVILEQNILKIK